MPDLYPYQVEQRDAALAELNSAAAALIVSATGCHHPTQGILMYSGHSEIARNVRVGDMLMGPDSKPRMVLELHRGSKPMCRIVPNKGKPFVVTEDHPLSLVRTNQGGTRNRGGEIVDVPVNEWSAWNKCQKHIHKLFRVGVEFPGPHIGGFDPYMMGVLLGDGSLGGGNLTVTTASPEIAEECYAFAATYGVMVRVQEGSGCRNYIFSTGQCGGKKNQAIEAVRRAGIFPMRCETKHIPFLVKTGSRHTRLEVLAGLIDTDGSLTANGYDFISKSARLAIDVGFVARSLGLAAYWKSCIKTCQTGASGQYYRVSISGDTDMVPCRIPSKRATPRLQKKDALRTGFTVEPIGEGVYVGFSVDGDHRYLMDDFTVTHNTGKTYTGCAVAREVVGGHGRVLVVAQKGELLRQWAESCDAFGLSWAVEKAGQSARTESVFGRVDVVLGSVASMQGERLKGWPENQFDLVIVDEAHHGVSDTHVRVVNHFSKAKRLGLTATPERGDEDSITRVFGRLVHEYPLARAIDEGYLVPPLFKRPPTRVDLSRIDCKAGDLNQGDLEEEISRHIEELVNSAKAEIGDRPTLAFTPKVKSAQAFADGFRQVGVTARSVHGKSEDRDTVVSEFKAMDYQALCSCDMIREGFDAKMVAALVMVRPTKSAIVYKQMLGRGLRTYPGKDYCLVVDFAWNSGRHDLFRPIDLFDTSATDVDTLKLAQSLIDSGKEQDPRKALRDAEEIRRQELAVRVAVRERAPRYQMVAYDPFEVAGLLGVPNRSAAGGKAVSRAHQLRLEAYKLPAAGVTDSQAKKLLAALDERRKRHMATHRQVALLVSNDVPADQARGMSFDEASGDLDILMAYKRRGD